MMLTTSRPDEPDSEFGEPELTPTQRSPAARRFQVSLQELFFISTFCAVELGVYLFLSPLCALLGGAAWVVVAIVQFFYPTNVLIGGLIGFVSAALCSGVVMVVHSSIPSTFISVILLFPAVGYMLGVYMAELNNSLD